MSRLVVVGSGASGVHFALTALERGFAVTMLDAGHARPDPVAPRATFPELPRTLDDPVAYFTGERGEGVVYPGAKPSYYGQPPSKSYIFEVPRGFAASAESMEPLFSFAAGGLAEAWTAGCYAFNRDDLAAFPCDPEDLERGYATVAGRIGMGVERDDLERFIPLHGEHLPPLPLDEHSEHLVRRYRALRDRLQRRLGFFLGRSRVATLSRDHRGRPGCSQLGRCLWGCPTGAIYAPSATLRECLAHPAFDYRPGLLVSHFELAEGGWVRQIHARRLDGGDPVVTAGDRFVLAAGALATSKIVLDSIFRATGRIERLSGLMDNRQVHVPFLTPRMIGRPAVTASYQYHHLAFGLVQPQPQDYVHGQITTLKAAAVHPILQGIPLDYRGALLALRRFRAGLGLANINLADTRRAESGVTLRPLGDGPATELVIDYRDDPEEAALRARATARTRRALRWLGCVVPPGTIRVLPKGASVHYSGTIPMSRDERPLTCDPSCRSRDFGNLYIADGASFPFLPAKNLTFTLMANAVRVAAALRRD